MDTLQLKACDIQGRLFELSTALGLESGVFIKAFMTSKVARNMDSEYNRMQWAGEEYLLEELKAEYSDKNLPLGKSFGREVMYWTGYTYRYWNLLTAESSCSILRQASAETMRRNYLMFHTMDTELAIENLQEIYRQRNNIAHGVLKHRENTFRINKVYFDKISDFEWSANLKSLGKKKVGFLYGRIIKDYFQIDGFSVRSKYRGIGIGHGLISALKKDLLDNHKEVSYILVYPKSWSDFSDEEDDLLTNEDLYSVYESLGFELVNLKADRSHPNQEMHQIIRKE